MTMAVDLDDLIAPRCRTASRLTTQEQRILALAATGWTAAAVAETLGLAPEAIRVALASIVTKVGARSMIEAVMIAVRTGLIDLPTDDDQVEDAKHGHRASAARPVMRLLRWGMADQRNAHGLVTPADMARRIVELRRDRIADVDGAAT